jgi:hypothetical protein
MLGKDPVLIQNGPFGHPAWRTTCASGFECADPDALSSPPLAAAYADSAGTAGTDVPSSQFVSAAKTPVPLVGVPPSGGSDSGASAPFPYPLFLRKKDFAGLKALVDFRLKPVLRRDCDHHAKPRQEKTRAESPAYHPADQPVSMTISRPFRASLFSPRYPGRCPGLVCHALSGLGALFGGTIIATTRWLAIWRVKALRCSFAAQWQRTIIATTQWLAI